MAPFGKQQEILRDLSTSSPEELSGKVGKGIPISPGSNVNGRLQATSLIEPRVQFPNRNSRNKHGKNLPLHPTQFAKLEIESKNKTSPKRWRFSFSGIQSAPHLVDMRVNPCG
jgi:hypothetical protein